MQIVPFASGKGGVGKSLLACNLAVALGEAGKRVVLVDLDLGGSNLHLMLGMRSVRHGIGTFLSGSNLSFEDIVFSTDYQNVRFVPGDAEIPGLANLTAAQKRMLVRRINKLDADFVLLDLGAGTSYNTLDFFLTSGNGVVVATPTPTAMVNAYLLLKNAVFRILTNSFKKKSKAGEYLKKQADSLQRIYIPTLLEKLKGIDPDGHQAFQEAFSRFTPRIILNMLEDPKDADTAHRLRRSSKQYLSLDVEHLGVIYRDDLQDIALGSGLPILRYKPSAVLSQAVYRIADKLIQLNMEDAAPVEWESVDDSYEEAQMEAHTDFDNKVDYIEDLLHSGALSQGDLVETIKNQQIEIQHLRRENMLYKSKLVKAMRQGYEA